MNIKKLLLLAFFCGCLSSLFAQKSPVILTVDNYAITLEEFENIYRKNNRDSAITQQSLDEYMELFINFKLKVAAARENGLDTVKKFIQELEGYRGQLARPYLTDSDLLNDLVNEAYQRQTEEIRASHILIKVEQDAAPEDTLRAFQKIIALRERVVRGEDFTQIARGQDGSEDPSAKDNGGDLGYFSAFRMVYPFEDAAYNTPVGSVSAPVRTRFGYHIIKVMDRRPARGEMHAAHITITDKKGGPADAEARIREVHAKLLAGEKFEDLALKYSEDGSSNKKGGELPRFTTGKMVEEFENQAFSLKHDGDISSPFKTSEYGWHIVKRLDHKPIATLKEVEKELKNKVSKDARAEKTKSSFVQKLKREYNYSMNEAALKTMSLAADTNVFNGKIKVKKKLLKKPLYTINGEVHKVKEFYDYLASRKGVRTKLTPQEYVMAEGKDFCEDAIIAYEDRRLEEKHPAFRLLMNEYREGILLFELTDQKVWSKAVKDSVGLQQFYNANQEKYTWPERVDAVIYTTASPEIAKQLRKYLAEGRDKSGIAGELNKESKLNIQIEEGIFARDEKEVLGLTPWQTGMSADVPYNGQIVIVQVNKILEPSPKKLEEARGLITSDYQAWLEQQWIQELRAKHKYTVDKTVLYSIR
ncbi:MAG: peptidylprolyl isomerase [Flavobacteriales bacterium]|nr:peptidylprolyl isomerase [Flavobacteriales bacterium]